MSEWTPWHHGMSALWTVLPTVYCTRDRNLQGHYTHILWCSSEHAWCDHSCQFVEEMHLTHPHFRSHFYPALHFFSLLLVCLPQP